MMLKVSGAYAQDFGEASTRLIPLCRDGHIGPHDRSVMIKRAGVEFVDFIKRARLAPGEVPIHTIALGANEYYGPNRNGDGFRDLVLRLRAHTFEKFARFYRNHANKDPKKSYGRIIKAAYNDRMHRIDLACGLNGTEETARVNGGLVADKELEKLARGEDIPTSMACKVSHDVCSGCGNHARTREEYCDGFARCKYGGLKHNITTTFDDGHQLHADNPDDLTWFDESAVYKGADRIASSLGLLLGGEKSASVRPMGGAELAERIGLTAPVDLLIDPALPRRVRAQVKLAHALADLESEAGRDAWGHAFTAEVQPPVGGFPDVRSTPLQLGRVMRALAAEKVALPLRDFLSLMLDKRAAAEVVDDVGAQLPGVFGRLAADADLGDELRHSPYNPSDDLPDTKTRTWAGMLVGDYGLGRKEAEARVSRSVLRGGIPRPRTRTEEAVKEASDRGGAEALARQYAMYKLAFLGAVEERGDAEFPLTSTLLVRQNYVD
jgi:hypothetical protein